MKVSEKFASNFLKAEDLQGRRVHVVIASVGDEEINDENHLVVYFRGKQKALILNKTNASYLAAAISDETDDWPGHEIVLYPTKVNFQGKMVDAIRIEMPPSAGVLKQQPHANGGAAMPMRRRASQQRRPSRRRTSAAAPRSMTKSLSEWGRGRSASATTARAIGR